MEENGNVKRRELQSELDRLERRIRDEISALRDSCGADILTVQSNIRDLTSAVRKAEERRGDYGRDRWKTAISAGLTVAVIGAGMVSFAIRSEVAPVIERQRAIEKSREELDRSHKESIAIVKDGLQQQLDERIDKIENTHDRSLVAEGDISRLWSLIGPDIRVDHGDDGTRGAIGAELRRLSDEIDRLNNQMNDLREKNASLRGYEIGVIGKENK